METLDQLERERGQLKPRRRSVRAKMLRWTLKILFVLGPWLAKLVQLWFELKRVRE